MIMISARLTRGRRLSSSHALAKAAISALRVGSNFAARLAPERQYLAANGYAPAYLDAWFVDAISARRFGWMRDINGRGQSIRNDYGTCSSGHSP